MVKKAAIVVLVATLLGTVASVVWIYESEKTRLEKSRREDVEKGSHYGGMVPQIPVSTKRGSVTARLFFRSDAEGMASLLKSEPRDLDLPTETRFRVRALVEELAKGPRFDGFGTLPKGAELRQVYFVDKQVVVDFSREISSNHPGGVMEETATVYSIVNTVMVNVPGANGVQLLVDGVRRDTLAGHVRTDRLLSFAPDVVAGWKP